MELIDITVKATRNKTGFSDAILVWTSAMDYYCLNADSIFMGLKEIQFQELLKSLSVHIKVCYYSHPVVYYGS